MTIDTKKLREDAEHHRMVAHQWDGRPEDTVNWEHAIRADEAADTIDALRAEVERLKAEPPIKADACKVPPAHNGDELNCICGVTWEYQNRNWELVAAPTQADSCKVPQEVLDALDRMCTPLHESRLAGATADADARCMKLIRDYVLSASPATPTKVETQGEKIDIGEYVLATKYSDGDPRDPWALGFYAGLDTHLPSSPRHMVHDGAGKNIRPNGYRRVARIRNDVGAWLLNVAAEQLEQSQPGTVNLWTMLTTEAFDLGSAPSTSPMEPGQEKKI